MRYFRSWVFNVGLALIVTGTLAYYRGIAIGVQDMNSAIVAHLNGPATDGSAFTFRYGYADVSDPWIPVGAGMVVGGFVVLCVGALRARRQRH